MIFLFNGSVENKGSDGVVILRFYLLLGYGLEVGCWGCFFYLDLF